MKLNNKGFAISTVLYSVLILFMLVLIAYLTIITETRKFNIRSFTSVLEVVKEKVIEINQVLENDEYYITLLSGNYQIESSNKKGYIYLSKNTIIQNIDGNIVINNDIINLNNINPNETKYIFNNITNSNQELQNEIKIISVYAKEKQ